jgi:hypothetical protein
VDGLAADPVMVGDLHHCEPVTQYLHDGVEALFCPQTTFALLAERFEELGGVPKVVVADRMACLKGGVVANVVVPTPDSVRLATLWVPESRSGSLS